MEAPDPRSVACHDWRGSAPSAATRAPPPALLTERGAVAMLPSPPTVTTSSPAPSGLRHTAMSLTRALSCLSLSRMTSCMVTTREGASARGATPGRSGTTTAERGDEGGGGSRCNLRSALAPSSTHRLGPCCRAADAGLESRTLLQPRRPPPPARAPLGRGPPTAQRTARAAAGRCIPTRCCWPPSLQARAQTRARQRAASRRRRGR